MLNIRDTTRKAGRMPITIVNSGVISSHATIVSGETLQIVGGDIFTSTTILSGGELNVNGGAVTSDTVVSSGGVSFVNNGGTATGMVILLGGYDDDGGQEYGAQVGNGGVQAVVDGVATSTTVEAGGLQVVLGQVADSSGYFVGASVDTVVLAGGAQQIEQYGTAIGTDVRSGGEMELVAGGSIQGGTIEAGGVLLLEAGLAEGVTLQSGATLVDFSGITGAVTSDFSVDPGATVISTGVVQIDTVISQTGLMTTIAAYDVVDLGSVASDARPSYYDPVYVLLGGTLTDTFVQAGEAEVFVENGGTADHTAFAIDTTLDLDLFGVADHTTLYGGLELVAGFGDITDQGGGSRDYDAVLSAGTQVDEGFALSAVVSSGGVQDVTNFGVASATTIFNGGTLLATSYGVALSAVVSSNGELSVSGGASTQDDVISDGGYELVLDNASDIATTVSANGLQIVEAGGFTLDDEIDADGNKIVDSGGFGQTDLISSGGIVTVASGGEVSGTVIMSGGTLAIYGSATGVDLETGGTEVAEGGAQLYVLAGETLAGVALDGATAYVLPGGTASGLTVHASGNLDVGDGGFALDSLLLGAPDVTGGAATQTISSGGMASGTDIQQAGDEEILAGGTASGSVVEMSGVQGVASAGQSYATMVMAGGFQEVDQGIAVGTTVQTSATQYVDGGGTAEGTVVAYEAAQYVDSAVAFIGLPGGNALSAHILDGGYQMVGSGAVASYTTLGSAIEVDFGLSISTTIGSGGALSAGGVSGEGRTSGTRIGAGGVESIAFAAVSEQSVVSAGGTQFVGNGGIAYDTTVLAGGTLINDGKVFGATVADGATEISQGGTLLGSVAFEAGATLIDQYGLVASDATISIAGTFENDSVAALDPSVMAVGALTGSGSVEIGAGSTLEVTAFAAAGQTIAFEAASGLFRIDDVVDMAATIAGFAPGDTIDLANVAFDPAGTVDPVGADGTLVIHENGGSVNLTLTGDDAGAMFHLASDGVAGTQLTEDAPCFVAGTRIATPRGEVAVEALAVGDPVVTASGAIRAIRWIGHRSYGGRFLGANPALRPILIRRDALADGVPARDLRVSPKHAMFLGGVLIPAERLVNGRSILQDEELADVSYFHVELDSHDILVAEGAPSESFVDCDSRLMFHNAHEFFARYPDDRGARWAFCAPRVDDGETVEAVRRRIAARAGLEPSAWEQAAPGPLDGRLDVAHAGGASGWAFDATWPDTPVRIEVLVDGMVAGTAVANTFRADLAQAGKGFGQGRGRCAFDVRFIPPLRADAAHVVTARRRGDQAALPGAGVLVPVLTDAIALAGRIDHCSTAAIAGWAIDVAGGPPVTLEILEDGRSLGQVVADRYRPDLDKAGRGACAFLFRFDPAAPPAEPSRVRVRRAADGAWLAAA